MFFSVLTRAAGKPLLAASCHSEATAYAGTEHTSSCTAHGGTGALANNLPTPFSSDPSAMSRVLVLKWDEVTCCLVSLDDLYSSEPYASSGARWVPTLLEPL